LRVRLLFPWFATRSAGKDTITCVSVARTVTGVCCVRFEDSDHNLADVHVHLPVRAQRPIEELRRRGYPVADRKTGEPLVRLPKRWRTALLLPERGEPDGHHARGGVLPANDLQAGDPRIGYVHYLPGLDPADEFFSIANRAGEVRQVHIPEAGYGSCVAASLGAQGPIGWLLSATALAMVRLCRT
jgi:hypothetical protein